jgi:hypothetical protein
LASPSSSRGRRADSSSPATLGHANSAASGTQLPGGSSDEDERGGRNCCHRSVRHRRTRVEFAALSWWWSQNWDRIGFL